MTGTIGPEGIVASVLVTVGPEMARGFCAVSGSMCGLFIGNDEAVACNHSRISAKKMAELVASKFCPGAIVGGQHGTMTREGFKGNSMYE